MYIEKFLATAYTYEGLCALLAHAESGRLSYYSCCCLVGAATADHALKGAAPHVGSMLLTNMIEGGHLHAARRLPHAFRAEAEFQELSRFDWLRRRRVIPLIRAEIARRDAANAAAKTNESQHATEVAEEMSHV